MNLYGLIGYPLTHSFSKKYFTQKFEKESIANSAYELFEMKDIADFPLLITQQPNLKGLNVTIPHKRNVIPFLNRLDQSAQKVGAVNVIKVTEGGQLTGYNSDYYGFKQSLEEWLPTNRLPELKALVLGNGGACQAVKAALSDMRIPYVVVSRQQSEETLGYDQLDTALFSEYQLIINTTPLGTFPDVGNCPPLPYELITSSHFLYDLVYNPPQTLFLEKGINAKAQVHNGLQMLQLQAEKAWEIWNN